MNPLADLEKFQYDSPILTYDMTAWQSLIQSLSPRRAPAGTLFWQQRQFTPYVHVLLSGCVKILQYTHDGRENVSYLAGAGCVLTEDSAMSGAPLRTSAIAVTPCRVYIVAKEDFLRQLKNDFDFTLRFLEYRNKKFLLFAARIQNLLQPHPAQRMATTLLGACQEFGSVTPRGIELNLGLSHALWAALIHANRVTVTRTLSRFEQEGWLLREGKRLVITAPEALMKVVEFRE